MRKIGECIESGAIAEGWTVDLGTYYQCTMRRNLEKNHTGYEYLVVTYYPSMCAVTVQRSVKISHDLPPSVAAITFDSNGSRVRHESAMKASGNDELDDELNDRSGENEEMTARTEPRRQEVILNTNRAVEILRQMIGLSI
jgi:hypothetical protein